MVALGRSPAPMGKYHQQQRQQQQISIYTTRPTNVFHDCVSTLVVVVVVVTVSSLVTCAHVVCVCKILCCFRYCCYRRRTVDSCGQLWTAVANCWLTEVAEELECCWVELAAAAVGLLYGTCYSCCCCFCLCNCRPAEQRHTSTQCAQCVRNSTC